MGARLTPLTTVLTTGLLLAAWGCGPARPAADAAAGETPTSSSFPSAPVPTLLVADPAHAVEMPGPRTQRLESHDLLVYSQVALTDSMVADIRAIKGVGAVERLSLAQATIENRSYEIAAVDPSTYRRFTPVASADVLGVWQRVAGGEIAATPAAGHRLAAPNGYIHLGSSKDAPDLHIGAYAEQIPGLDLVVNERWGESLGMVMDNAVLISTRINSPQSVRPRIERIVGHKASVQAMDVVAIRGLDPEVVQTAVLTGGSIASVVGTFNYRVLGGGHIAPDPSWVASHISTQTMPIIGPMTCNNAIFPQLKAALDEIQSTPGLAAKIHPSEYAGCYYPRFIAGTTVLSNHSFGLAFDINVPGNQRGTPGEIDRTVVSIFQKWGFTWGGTWSYTDPMHFEMNQVVKPA
jgi:hypothetical protein